jgi:hypothetical protein
MTATVFYDNTNEIAQLTVTFTSSGSPASPTTVSLVVTDPSGTQTTYTTSNGITQSGTGIYTAAITCLPALTGVDGLWSYVWIGTGAVSDVQPGTWRVLPTTIGTWYIGLDEFKDRLGITDAADDSQAQIAIQTTAQWINEYTGRHFNRVTEVRTYEPTNIWVLNIDDLVSVTAVNLDPNGNGVFSQALVQNVDYELRLGDGLYNVNATGIARPYRQLQIIQTGNWFPFTWPYSRLDRVQIIGTWGWSSVPPPVTQANFILAADLFKMKDAPFGVAGVSDLGVVRIQSNPWLTEMLRPYINPRRKVGV